MKQILGLIGGHADYTPEEEFQNMLDELDKMIADQKSVEYDKGWNDALKKAQEIIGRKTND